MAARRALVFGLGYVGAAFAQALRARGWEVAGTNRAGPLAFAGEPTPALYAALAGAEAVLASIPPDGAGDPAFRAFASALAAAPPPWTGYLSTTGVFGDRAGGWAFEWEAPTPLDPQGQNRVTAEAQWLSLARPAHLFRLPGIYGPGRSALDRAGEGRAVIKPGQVFNRVHVEDIVAGLLASMAKPNPGRAYTLCDDEPAPPQDVAAYAAGLLGLAPPTPVAFEAAGLSPMAQRFYAQNKRLSNARAKAELGWRPRYPSYREGLRAIAKGQHP